MKGFKVFVLGILLIADLHLRANDYVFEQITSNTGITFNAIAGITEDKYGYIWFGCNRGLYNYNTSEIKKINFDSSNPSDNRSNVIRYLYKDKNQKLWVCTDNGIYYLNESSNTFTHLDFNNSNVFTSIFTTLLYQVNNDNYVTIINGRLYKFNTTDLIAEQVETGTQNNVIAYFVNDPNGNLFIATNDGLIFKTDSLLTKPEQIFQSSLRAVNTLSFINDQIWIGYRNDGIEVISPDGELIKVFKEELEGRQHIISNRTRRIIKGPYNDVWIGMSGGISIIGSDGNNHIVPEVHNGLPHDGIFDLFLDSNNGVWVGTWSGGLAYHHKLNYKFQHVQSSMANATLLNSVISSFSEDKNGDIWVGSENNGLFLYDVNRNSYRRIENLPIQRIKSIASDNRQRLWFGTFFEGLWLKEGDQLKRIGDMEGIFSTILPVQNGVWIGQRGGGAIFYNEKNKSVEHYVYNASDSFLISSNLIWEIFEDSKQNIWICSDNGISVRFKGNNQFTNYFKETHGLSSNVNYTITEDKSGKIWIGTAGSGIDIYDPATKSFGKFSLNESIKNADVYCILKDLKGNIWFSSNQGIYAYYNDSQTLKNFTIEDGLLGQQFHPNSGFVSKNGILFFGGGNGFNIINPEIVQPNTNVSKIYLSKLTINNQSIDEQKPRFINSNYLPGLNEIELNYNQNTITIAFIVNSYIKNSKSKFKYRLINYIDEWTESNYNENVTFTKIPPGKYTLQVGYINNDGLSNSPQKEFQIKINPPFWLSWYAYLFYFMLIGSVIFISVREMQFREKSRANQMLFSEKVKFFTNISHEFRTPLTLIISPVHSLLKKYVNDNETSHDLKTIQRNADRLLRLTNQLLDFRLIELNSVQLKRSKVDIIALCKNVYECFEYQIKEKEINCIYTSSFKSFNMLIDAEKIEKVLYNILSNALKYSDEKGQIIISIEQKTLNSDNYKNMVSTGHMVLGNILEIKVKDNGKGIKKDIIKNIFDRFFIDNEKAATGTGIGLHICQEYIKMHNGNIMVESDPGKETTFYINIPIEEEHEFEQENLIIQSFFDTTHKTDKELEQVSSASDKPIVLFAEDNNELRKHYKNLLSAKYKVISAKNGTQAFEIATELIPDLIISDVLMPGLDGMSLTEQIRKNEKTNHIPIILLTALSEDKFKIESMIKGANAFLTKPVDEELLFANIDSILSNADAIRKRFKDNQKTAGDKSGLNPSFIEKVELIVEKNLQNQNFEITELAFHAGISRSSLQRKIKKTVNMSPSEFIREVRLKKAVELLKNSEYNIDEIAIIVGFNSTSYFIRSFKKKYEMTPTAYKQNFGKQKTSER